MILPIGDTPNPERFFPFVNWGLIVANVAIYVLITLPLSGASVDPTDPALLEYLVAMGADLPVDPQLLRKLLSQMSRYDLFVFQHGYKPGAAELSDLFSSMFLHGGFLHLAGNMLFLWIFGDNVEHRLGRLGYLVVYLATGACASLTFAMIAGSSLIPLDGASGAISGALGLYFLLFPRNRVKTLVLFFPFFFDVLLIPARWVLGFYVVVDNLLPMVLGADSGVAYGAHIGGFAGGLVIALAGERLGWRWPWAERRWQRKVAPDRRGLAAEDKSFLRADELESLVARGNRGEALKLLASLRPPELARLAAGTCVQLSVWLEEAGYPSAAASLLRRCLASSPGDRDLAQIYLALGLMRLRQGQPTAAYQHLLAVLDLDAAPETEGRAREALSRIAIYRRKPRR